MIKIFVDDMRVPLSKDWVLASTVKEAQDLIKQGEDFVLSLDHDLGQREGDDDNTRSLLLWCIDNGYTPQAAAVHSSNPVGAQWLKECLLYDFPEPIPRIAPPSWSI